VSRRTREAERRRRLLTRTLPLALVAIVAFVAGAAIGAPGSPGKEAANRFAAAWAAHDFKAMYRELNDSSRRAVDLKSFAAAYREAELTATQRRLLVGNATDPQTIEGQTVVPLPVVITTVAFGKLEDEVNLPYEEGGIAWSQSLVFPGLRRGEHLEAELELAPRAAILAADGEPLAEGPADEREHPLGEAMIDVTGEVGEASEEDEGLLARQGYPPGSPVGVSGLEQAFNRRLAGKPGGKLMAVAAKGGGEGRILAEAAPTPGAPVKTTIDTEIQQAAVTALAGRAGGVAVLDAKNGDVRALAGQAYSAPQPPGSTFKIVTTTAALQAHVVSLDDEFEVNDGINVGGRFLNNANGEYCGGTFRQAFAESCNSVFAPLGPKVGNDGLVGTAEKFGFNHPITLFAPKLVREVGPPESTIPEEIGEEIDLGVSAIGQGEVQATPLEMATVAQTIANDGVREPTSIVNNKRLRPHPESTRVMSKKLAGELTELMIGVVTEGTGYAAAIPEGQVAGKTGTAELGPKPGEEDKENPVQIKDAWFSAFAPADKPKLAIGVLLIEAEAAGGEVAAPAAAEVLSTGLE
jgi:cell division protein FtsI/penicillin-binding protein 2